MARYYEFPAGSGSWVEETVEKEGGGRFLVKRQYTGDPRSPESNARLNDVVQFDSDTEETARRFRAGVLDSNGVLQYLDWDDV